jgi:tRNA U34 5-methylaminomethyl-2-thiouridine-forming methyltransferase MnmC
MSDVKIILTADGSHSLLNTTLNETYHSVHGAVQESNHVFIKNGLEFFCHRSTPALIDIFEMGFGTGLNAWLTAKYGTQVNRHINYTSLELFPLPEEIWRQLNYAGRDDSRLLFDQLHQAPWTKKTLIQPNFSLHKINAALTDVSFEDASFDLVYFDAFAPSKQPDLWHFSVLEKIVLTLRSGGIFVTYCAKGQLKRDLKSIGLSVETLPGPPGKKEMVRALKI